MTARYFTTLIALFVAFSSSMASARDPSIGLCTRKDDFVAKLELIDPLVQELTAAKEDRERDGLAAKLAETFGGGIAIECLIRYREPEMAEVFLKLLDHERWPIRARALYGLKMVGAQKHVAEVARLLDDPEPQVRELAASTLGHLGGEAAIAALKRREPDEENAYVQATIAASLELAALDEKPYARLSKQAEPWAETLVGPEGARRVEWQWVVKGKNSFNDYDAKAHELPVAKDFCYPVSWYKDCLFSGYPRRSFGGGGGRHAGEDCAWFREGCSYYAIADGLVRMVQGAGGDWGFFIVIEHLLESGEYVTAVYGHCGWDVLVKPGQLVKKGEKIGTQGLSTSVENGGYGSHLHFGLGHGPYRRSGKLHTGGPINLKIDGKDIPGKVARFGYSKEEKNKFGWPKITALVALSDGNTRQITLPEEAAGSEVAWMKAYVPNCRGWLNPQTFLPDHVEGPSEVPAEEPASPSEPESVLPDHVEEPAEEPPSPSKPEYVVAEGGNIPVKIVGGRLVAPVELSTIYRRIPVNLFIEFDTPCGLRLHDNVAVALQAETPFGATNPVSIHFPKFAVTVEHRERGPQHDYSDFTRLHSHEINEDALVGAIGAKILSRYRVTFDLQKGVLELEVPGEREEKAGEDAEEPPREEELVVAITTTDDIVWLPIQLASGKVHAMAVSTTNYDSFVDSEWCDRLGFPAGDVGSLNLGKLDLGSFVAFRPAEVVYVHPDGAIGVLGLNLLKHLRLTIDRKNKTAVCRVTAPPNFPVADREYFKAMVAEDADQLEAWLEKYPTERLSQEAAQQLLDYRIDEDAEPEQIEQAIRRLRATWREDMVSTQALDLMRVLRAAGHPLRAVFAGELGIEGGRDDRYPNSVHRLHASLGEILLENDEDQRAWRHLLSAAFGLRDDGPINLKLGQYYEKQGRYKRALSRYVQAVIKVEAGEEALEGLERVQRKMGDAQPLSVDTIGPRIAGKTYNYAAATRYRPKPGEETNRVSLVEFFTNTHFKDPDKEEGAIGGALGNEGVMTYFSRRKVAMLTYHLTHPQLELDSLVNELAQATADFYRVPPSVQLVDGTRRFPGQGHLTDAESIFHAGRDVILASLKEKSDFELELASSIEGDQIAGTLKVTHLSAGDSAKASATIQIVLAERGVLYPGKSKIVIQRMVARAALTDRLEGIPFEPQDGRMTIPFSHSLAAITRANVDFLKQSELAGAGTAQTFAAKMDPRQLTVVAYVRDGSSKKILQAIQVNPTQP